MNKEVLHKVCVRIRIIENNNSLSQGSGLILKQGETYYVLTAYHCIYGDKDEFSHLPISCIAIEKQEEYNTEFSLCSLKNIVKVSKDEDWALLELDSSFTDTIPEVFLAEDFEIDTMASFRGYQNMNPNEARTFECQVIDKKSNNEFKLTLAPGHDFKKERDNAKGLSGSGAFVIRNEGIYLTGILKSVKGEEALNNDIKCAGLDSLREILNNFRSLNGTFEDHAGAEGYEILQPKEFRNIEDKISAVTENFPGYRISQFYRELASGQTELQYLPERVVSAMKYRIFEVCQNELMGFVESSLQGRYTTEQILEMIETYTDKAVDIIKAKAESYEYPLKDRFILKKIVLNLINDCYLSFDKDGIYE